MTMPLNTADPLVSAHPAVRSVRRPDPILQELYEVRARLNAEAGYSVERLLDIVKREAQQYKAKPAH